MRSAPWWWLGRKSFRKNQYRKFNIRSSELTPGDDYGMLREVLQRRFKRLLEENPRLTADAALAAVLTGEPDEGDEQRWPDLVLIDGGQGQLSVAAKTLAAIGVTGVPLVAIAKGPDRDAGRETFFMPGRAPFKLPPRDPLLYFIERLRDEAHRFAIGSHRARRKKDIREAGLQEIPGIGPTRKRALLRYFGTLKAIERASLPGILPRVPGINAETARKIYEFFHEQAAVYRSSSGWRGNGRGRMLIKRQETSPMWWRMRSRTRPTWRVREILTALAKHLHAFGARRASDRGGIREGGAICRRARRRPTPPTTKRC